MRNPARLLPLLAIVLTAAPSLRPQGEPERKEPLYPGTSLSAADGTGLKQLAAETQRELRGDILPWWTHNTKNPANGGFVGAILADMTVVAKDPRGALLTSRILWTFSSAYRIYRDPAYLEMARYAYADLQHFVDPRFGGLYWSISEDGKPVDDEKLIYGQVFGVYALAEYFRASGDRAALDQAIGIYNLVERNAHDRKYGGYFDSRGRDWGALPGGSRRLLGPSSKSQNSHIHILEAYTELLRVWPDPGLRENQRALIELTMDRIVDAKTHHLVLFMNDDWTPIGSDISYGHDIELSWLLVEAAQGLGDAKLLSRAKSVSLDIARVTLAEGVDPDGGVISEGSPAGYTNTSKEWWEQAESMVGFLNAYQLSGDWRYLAASRRAWAYIQASFLDREHGDWYNLLWRDGTPIPLPKESVWKCPYHSGRSCMEVNARVLEILQASARP